MRLEYFFAILKPESPALIHIHYIEKHGQNAHQNPP